MSIIIKTAVEIEKMRVAGKLAAEVLEMIEPFVVPGVTTDQLDKLCHDYIVDVQQAIPAPLKVIKVHRFVQILTTQEIGVGCCAVH